MPAIAELAVSRALSTLPVSRKCILPSELSKYVIPGQVESCAKAGECCWSTECASGGKPRSHSQPRCVAAVAPGYAAQPPASPGVGYLPGTVSVPQNWSL